MIEFLLRHFETSFQVPKTFTVSQLCERHAEKLIITSEGFNALIATVTTYTIIEISDR
jgi:hypothetical protein